MAARSTLHRFFINVDFDVHADGASEAEFAPLIEALDPVAMHLPRPRGLATFELNKDPDEPGPAILAFVAQVERLPPAARAFWDAATRRVFDIGFESGRQPRCPFSECYRLSPEVLAAVARVRGEIAITMYALDEGNDIPPEEHTPDDG